MKKERKQTNFNSSSTVTAVRLCKSSIGRESLYFCALCGSGKGDDEMMRFDTSEEFEAHLRSAHCSKDGDSYVCKFSSNDVCPSLPMEGVSDEDYALHLQKCHFQNDNALENGGKTSISLSREANDQFTVNSFTQNLSAVLSDPGRSRSEVTAFFTRHWGEQFVPRSQIGPAPEFPRITAENFRHYLSTTAKKHRHYLKVRRALRSANLSRESERTSIDPDEVPSLFFNSNFSLRDVRTFELVFLEPRVNEVDALVSAAERRRAADVRQKPLAATRPESSGSLASVASLQNQLPVEASNGRFFRPYKFLHNRLEYYHDTLGILLNHQLENKSEEFWRTVNSYSALHGELESAIQKAQIVRKSLRKTDEEIFAKSDKLVRLHWARENRQRLLRKLDDIACLRDAQTTVQMLLNQNNFPKALECIETAHEVLDSDLKGVTCFRHLSSQLNEMHNVIGKMLHEEFIAMIQRELGKAIEKESESSYQESQLHPILLGLIRCRDFRFLQVLQTEIVEAAKNTVRQIILGRFVECNFQLSGFDPSLGNLGEQITKMTLDQWIETLNALFNSLYLLCCRVMSIQDLILENLALVESLNIPDRRFDAGGSLNLSRGASRASSRVTSTAPLAAGDEEEHTSSSLAEVQQSSDVPIENTTRGINIEEENSKASKGHVTGAGSSAASALALGCFDFRQLRAVAPRLLEHAVIAAEDSACKIVVPKGSKGGFLEKCNPQTFYKVLEMVDEFVEKCRKIPQQFVSATASPAPLSPRPLDDIVDDMASSRLETVLKATANSPLRSLLQKQTTTFIANFHEQKRQKLKRILDAEQWKPIEFPPVFQQIIDHFEDNGTLRDVSTPSDLILANDTDSADFNENEKSTTNSRKSSTSTTVTTNTFNVPADFVVLNGEKFIVVGTALLLLRILAEYCGLLQIFPQRVSELNLNVVEILKQFNSRTCQLILGAGALKMVGLKTISVKNLALSCRSLQLIARFVPVIRAEFLAHLPPSRQNTLRHFDQVLKDFNDHIEEITKRLLILMDNHLIGALSEWKVDEKTPTPCFQHIVKQIGKFFSGYSAVMPGDQSLEILLKIHSNFKLYFKQHLQARGITPHDSLTYGLAGQDFMYYVENMKAFPDCKDFPDDSLNDVLQKNNS